MGRRRLRIAGTVQGVGFRPHLHRLARGLSLTGAAGNDDEGVWCEVQGRRDDLDEFEARVAAEAPPLARVDSVRAAEVPRVDSEREFSIAPSASGAGTVAGTVPPDVAACAACLAEIAEPGGRRYRYAFTCCTDCGPRYTVVRNLPYDRERTSMAAFVLCGACEAEYRDPADRRHHAQAVCCPVCGPTLSLRSITGEALEGDPIEEAAALLRAGRIVAVKGVGGYQLACQADDSAAVAQLRRRKHREEKPFALLVASVEAAQALVALDDLAVRALCGPEAPIVLAPRRQPALVAAEVAPDTRHLAASPAQVAAEVAPDTGLLGVMLPATPLHALLAEAAGVTLVCTSGNRSDEPIVTDDAAVERDLGGIADAVLGHDRVIERRADDSVGHVVAGSFQLLRRARGYAPGTVRLDGDGPVVLAVGAELKSTVCLALGADAHLSVHLGDLEHPAALAAFEAAVADLLQLTRAAPKLVVHDLHPEYLSTKFAAGADLAPLLGVQHHHAHLASCLADAGHHGPAIGVMFDGMGWGTDGALWGGEILIGDATGYERFAHLAPVPMPGGTAAIRHPWRMALSHIDAAYHTDLRASAAALGRNPSTASGAPRPDLPDVPSLAVHAEDAAQVLDQCRSGRSILTTSIGRLFDSVAALCGIVEIATYEGQAAVRLEQAAGPDARRYPVEISDGTPAVIGSSPLVEAVVADVLAGRDPALVSGAFHRWVADVVVAAAHCAQEASGLSAVALSGGVFQNRRLVELLVPDLQQAGFEVIRHRQVPPNDGGISLGQAAIGRSMLSTGGS